MNIKLPPKVPKRGRPKGSEVTVVGLPKKKKRRNNKPVALISKHPKEQEKGICYLQSIYVYSHFSTVMLKWFVSDQDVSKAMHEDTLLDEQVVETRPERVPNSCIDENASIYRIRKYFTDDGWTQVMQLIETKKNNATYYCKMCEKILEGASICCDCCLEWLHLSCAGLQKAPKGRRKEWFCRLCYK